MSKQKYKIYQNGQFLGYHGGSSPTQAIEKMSHTLYATTYDVNFNDYFDVYHGFNHAQIYVGEI